MITGLSAPRPGKTCSRAVSSGVRFDQQSSIVKWLSNLTGRKLSHLTPLDLTSSAPRTLPETLKPHETRIS